MAKAKTSRRSTGRIGRDDLLSLVGPMLEQMMTARAAREDARLKVFERAWETCKDTKMRVALAVAYLEGGEKS